MISPNRKTVSTALGHDNRRRSYRIHCTLQVEVTLASQPIRVGRLKDAAKEGVGFYSWEPIQRGERIVVRIPDLAGKTPIEARVVRCHQTQSGKFEVGAELPAGGTSRYDSVLEDIRDIEYFRKTVEGVRGESFSSDDALAEWRQRHARRAMN